MLTCGQRGTLINWTPGRPGTAPGIGPTGRSPTLHELEYMEGTGVSKSQPGSPVLSNRSASPITPGAPGFPRAAPNGRVTRQSDPASQLEMLLGIVSKVTQYNEQNFTRFYTTPLGPLTNSL